MQKIEAVPEGNIETFRRLEAIQVYLQGCLDEGNIPTVVQVKKIKQDIDELVKEIE